MRIRAALALLLALAGCTTTPPQRHVIETQAQIAWPPAEAWPRLMTWARGTALPIAIADEKSGTLQATLTSDWIGRHVDCGYIPSGTLPDPQGTVTVQLAPAGSGSAVTVNVAATDRMWLSGGSGITRNACYSRGTLEQEVFTALAAP